MTSLPLQYLGERYRVDVHVLAGHKNAYSGRCCKYQYMDMHVNNKQVDEIITLTYEDEKIAKCYLRMLNFENQQYMFDIINYVAHNKNS